MRARIAAAWGPLARDGRRGSLIDAAFLLALCLLGLIGFQSAFGGDTYLIVGGVGVALGIVVSELSQRLGQPVLVDVALTAVVFFLVGGLIAVPSTAIGGVIPTAGTVTALLGVATQGWKDLLTTVPPIGNADKLLAIPYLIGLLAGAGGYGLARRTRLAALPVVAPSAVLALSILFGSELPVAVLLQGSVFAALVVGWLALRSRRFQPPSLNAARRPWRVVWAVGIVAVAGLLAPIVGPNLPLSGRDRTVLSRYIVPPFDANNLPSPLGTFRSFRPGLDHPLAIATLFTITGLKPGALVTIATMDSYDGLAFGFGGDGGTGTGSSDVFRRYGSPIPAPLPGQSVQLTVRISALGGVWIPTIGQVTSVQFTGTDAANLTAGFVYNPVTGTAADTAGLSPGATYRLSVVVPVPSTADLEAAAAGSDQLAVTIPTALQSAAVSWVSGASGAWSKVMTLAHHLLIDGSYSDGTEKFPLAAAGHSTGRLTEFVEGDPGLDNALVGDDEQFAATLALMSDAVGVPARVVLGAVVPQTGDDITGSDVRAWVQVSLAGLGWVAVDPDLFIDRGRKATPPNPRKTPVPKPQAVVPPPTVTNLRPPPEQPLQSSATSIPISPLPRVHAGFRVPAVLIDLLLYAGLPLLLLAAGCRVILGLKARRRRRRRRRGSPSAQIAGAWSELIDLTIDLGLTPPERGTRREQARTIAGLGLTALAEDADAAVFGPGDPVPAHVDSYWTAMDHVGDRLKAGVGRWRRLRAALSLRSLRSAARAGFQGDA